MTYEALCFLNCGLHIFYLVFKYAEAEHIAITCHKCLNFNTFFYYVISKNGLGFQNLCIKFCFWYKGVPETQEASYFVHWFKPTETMILLEIAVIVLEWLIDWLIDWLIGWLIELHFSQE